MQREKMKEKEMMDEMMMEAKVMIRTIACFSSKF